MFIDPEKKLHQQQRLLSKVHLRRVALADTLSKKRRALALESFTNETTDIQLIVCILSCKTFSKYFLRFHIIILF